MIRHERFKQEQWIEEMDLKDFVLLPPMPPVFAQAQSDLPTLPYPLILSDYAGEPFFMAFGRLYFQRLLKPVQIQRIERYRNSRDALVAALSARLSETESLTPAARRQALAVIASDQQPSLLALEAEAEAIRKELAGLDGGTALAKQRDSDETVKTPGLRDYLSALFAAHYDEGFSVEQRQLLHEIALESLLKPTSTGDEASFFLPATARIRWPQIPAAANATKDRFNVLRATMRDQLAQTIVSAQEKMSARKRALNHSELTKKQTPQFEALHHLAEEIRLATAELPYPDQPGPSDYPPDLVRLVGSAVAAKNDFRLTSGRKISELNREFAPARFKVAVENNHPMILEISSSQSERKTEIPGEALHQRLSASNEHLQREYQDLATKFEAARAAVLRYRESLTGADVPSANQLSAALAQAHVQDQTWRRFADYRNATLVPGLSAAQRRLLFNAALRDLEKHRLQSLD